MTASPVDLVVHPTRSQLTRVRLHHFLGSRTGIQLAFGCCVALIVLWLTWRYLGAPWPERNTWILAGAPFVFALMLLGVVFGDFRNPQTRSYLQGGTRYCLLDHRFETSGPWGDSSLTWQSVTRAREFEDFLAVWVGNSVHILPKGDFAPGQVESARALLREKVGRLASVRRG